MKQDTVQALEDLRVLFQETYTFKVVVRFFEKTRKGYVSREMKREVKAPSMKEACAKAMSEFQGNKNVRIGGIEVPKEVKTGSKRPVNPFLSMKKQQEPKRKSK